MNNKKSVLHITDKNQDFAETALVHWFLENAEKLPWRPTDLLQKRSPYAVWISEIMLQQTQVGAVQEHFKRWMRAFPTVEKLAKAREETVLKHWQGLGYYSRARNILKAAQILKEKYNFKFPTDRNELETLPGIGKYTAGAILSFAFHLPASILDGNLIRIFSRLYTIHFLPDSAEHQRIYWNHAEHFATSKNSFLKNEALMELGRNICKVKNPLCLMCPLATICKAHHENCINDFPPQKKRSYQAFFGIVVIAESQDGKFFISTKSSVFFKSEKCFPHFESNPLQAEGLPPEIEFLFPNFQIDSFRYGKSFNHSITRYKITMRTLYIHFKDNAPHSKNWISREQIKNLPSAFCLKAFAASFEETAF